MLWDFDNRIKEGKVVWFGETENESRTKAEWEIL